MEIETTWMRSTYLFHDTNVRLTHYSVIPESSGNFRIRCLNEEPILSQNQFDLSFVGIAVRTVLTVQTPAP